MVKGTVKDFNKFLRQRDLTRSFNKWKKIKSSKKKVIPVVFDNYDGTQRRGKIYVVRQGNRTLFKDFNTLENLGSSRKKVNLALKQLFGKKKENKSFFVKGWNVEYQEKKNSIKLKNKHITYSYNESLNRLRSVTRTNKSRSNMEGRLTCDLTYVGKTGTKSRIQISSPSAFLNSKAKREKQINWCIIRGTGMAGFSLVDVIINDIWFEYWQDRQEKLKKIK